MYPDAHAATFATQDAVCFLKGTVMAQGLIKESAIQKAEEAGPGIAKFVVRLSDGLLPPEEISTLKELGMVEFFPFVRQAMVVLPGRCLLEVAELPTVVEVI